MHLPLSLVFCVGCANLAAAVDSFDVVTQNRDRKEALSKDTTEHTELGCNGETLYTIRNRLSTALVTVNIAVDPPRVFAVYDRPAHENSAYLSTFEIIKSEHSDAYVIRTFQDKYVLYQGSDCNILNDCPIIATQDTKERDIGLWYLELGPQLTYIQNKETSHYLYNYLLDFSLDVEKEKSGKLVTVYNKGLEILGSVYWYITKYEPKCSLTVEVTTTTGTGDSCKCITTTGTLTTTAETPTTNSTGDSCGCVCTTAAEKPTTSAEKSTSTTTKKSTTTTTEAPTTEGDEGDEDEDEYEEENVDAFENGDELVYEYYYDYDH